MRKVQLKIIFLCLVSVCFLMDTQAQDAPRPRSERKKAAREAINNLHGGTLIIRLKSKRNKIDKLEELLAAPDIDEKLRARLSKKLKNTIEERNKYNLTLTNAFEEYYSFSKVYYMYDTASVSLKNGIRKGIFLDKGLELDANIEIPEGSFYIVRTGTTNASSTTGIQALVVMDNQFKDFERPFPYYVRVNSISRLFTRIFNHKKLVKKDAKEVVLRLGRNFQFYYENVNGMR